MNERLLFVARVGLLLSCSLCAQGPLPSILGTVTSSNGVALPGAIVRLQSVSISGARTYVTDTNGRYRAIGLLPGTYTVSVSLAGFAAVTTSTSLSGQAPVGEVNVTLAAVTRPAEIVSPDRDGQLVVVPSTRSSPASSLLIPLPLGRSYGPSFVKSLRS